MKNEPKELFHGLSVQGLYKEYPTRGDPLVVLRNVSFRLSSGEAMAIMGPSGSGKSTLLHILGTLDTPTEPTEDKVLIDGRDPFALSEPELAIFRNREIGFVFQDHHLLPQCSALENVLIPMMGAGSQGEADEKRALMLLDRVGLAARRDYRPAELSGGERQRIALARSLVNRPRLMLADEPTGNLDRATAESVATLLLELHREEGALLVVVTHSLTLANHFNRNFKMVDGTLQPIH